MQCGTSLHKLVLVEKTTKHSFSLSPVNTQNTKLFETTQRRYFTARSFIPKDKLYCWLKVSTFLFHIQLHRGFLSAIGIWYLSYRLPNSPSSSGPQLHHPTTTTTDLVLTHSNILVLDYFHQTNEFGSSSIVELTNKYKHCKHWYLSSIFVLLYFKQNHLLRSSTPTGHRFWHIRNRTSCW